MNVLWRGTFGDYLLELWNPQFDDDSRFINNSTLYNLRSYAVAYLRATGPLPLLRVGTQPYGILPIVGKRFSSTGSAIESGIAKVLGVLRPMWELASRSVPTMTDGNVDKARDILQTAAWSQTAFYRDKDSDKTFCQIPGPFSDAQHSSRSVLVQAILGSLGIADYTMAHIYSCNDFRPDPPYSAGYLAGVPWCWPTTRIREERSRRRCGRSRQANNYICADCDGLHSERRPRRGRCCMRISPDRHCCRRSCRTRFRKNRVTPSRSSCSRARR